MPTLPCNIVLLPGDELAQNAIAVSRKISESFDTFFTLELGKFYPHLSLYMFQLDEADISKVAEIMAKIAADLSALNVRATRYNLGRGWGVGYVDPEYEITEELRELQHLLIDALNPVRAGMRESDVAKMQDAAGEKLENLQKYGYPAIGNLFRPHITLTKLTEHHPEVLELLPDIHAFDGSFTKLGLFEMGANGTCVRQIATVDLQ